MSSLSHIAVAQNDFYIFGAISNTDADVALGGLNSIDDDDSSFTLGGGYEFSEYLSLEAAYRDFGNQAGQTDCPPGFACLIIPLLTEADVTAFSVSVLGSFRITDTLDGYGRLGVTRWDVEFDGISSAFDDSGEDLHYGVGLRWSFEDHWKIFAEYTQVDLDIVGVSVGIRYGF
jgi:opacity protein-like surface antigen